MYRFSSHQSVKPGSSQFFACGFLITLLGLVNACGGGSSVDPSPADPEPVVIGDSTINTATARLEPNRLSILPNGSSIPLVVTFPGDETTWPTDLTYRWLADGSVTIENISNSDFTAENSAVLKADDLTTETPVTGTLSVAVFSADSAQIGYASSEVIVEPRLTVKPAALEILRYDVPDAGAGTSHACAVVAVSPEPEAVSYILRGVGGFDELFYKDQVTQSPTTADTFCDLDEVDYPHGFFLLSASSGPTVGSAVIDGIEKRLEILGDRFNDFILTVDVTY